MIFGFDEHRGKVDVGAMLTQLQTNFQNNVNSLYNAFVAKGVTPSARTVGALVTAVTTLYNKARNDGVKIIKFEASLNANGINFFDGGVDYTKQTIYSIKQTSRNTDLWFGYYEGLAPNRTWVTVATVQKNVEFVIPSNWTQAYLLIPSSGEPRCDFEIKTKP